jgi:hypothetical protein
VPKAKAEPARLDSDRKAKPKTRIVKHAKQGDCVGPHTHLDSLEYRDEESEFFL